MKMNTAVLDAVNGELHIEQIPVPEPRLGEVLVKVAACGVCHTDLHVIKGEVGFPTPCVLGHEVSGHVEAIGPAVEDIAVGDAVVCSFIMPCGSCYFCARGEDDLCERFFTHNRLRGTLYDGESRLARSDGEPLAMYSMGGFAEYCVVPATDVFRAPDSIRLEDAAILGCAAFTAYGLLRNAGDLRAAESVAIVGTGGVGSMAVQLAGIFGAAQVIAVDIHDDKLIAAKELGATNVVNSAREDLGAAVRDLTGGRGVDVAVEAFGSRETVAAALDCVRDGGRVAMAGIAPSGTTADFEITRVVRRRIQLTGSYGGRVRTDMPAVLQLAGAGKLRPQDAITRRYALSESDAAFTALRNGEVVGRAVVEMAS